MGVGTDLHKAPKRIKYLWVLVAILPMISQWREGIAGDPVREANIAIRHIGEIGNQFLDFLFPLVAKGWSRLELDGWNLR